jgi:LCP family protein required for cell wall assembly
MSPEPPRKAWWMARRVFVAAVGIMLLAGGATYVVAINEVGKVVEALGQTKAVKIAPRVLLPTSTGSPQTLLLVGNDERPPPKSNPNGAVLPHSNEMLLVRIDPSKPTISMLSIPRELQVTFTAPNGEVITNRINSAYTYGGIELMLKTIKNVFGISVNHVFVVTFPKFRRAVDEIGCVYMTVDRRYYHVNEPGGEQYFEINLQPGYQRLCGKEALEFVANRHEDTSLDRDARDQRFLLEVKAQYGATLFENRERFERVLGKAVETDLHGTGQVLDLLELLVGAEGKPVRQVPFHVTLLPTVDTASPEEIGEAVHAFMAGTAAIPTAKLHRDVHAARPHPHASAPGLSLTPTTAEELQKARAASPELPFPLEYPRVRNAYAGAEPDSLRIYDLRDQQGHSHPAYVIVIDQGTLGQFYDVQGTTWTDPPLLSDPSQTVQIGSRTYNLFYSGEEIRTISWQEGNATYWIQNTLTNAVQPKEMLAMAEQTLPVISVHSSNVYVAPAIPTLHDIKLPPREVGENGLASKLEAALGFVGLVAVALLALLVVSRQRELIRLRAEVGQAMQLEAQQRPLLANVGASRPEPQAEGPPAG